MNPQLSSIFSRRSIRIFSGNVVAKDKVKDLLEAAMAAPSAQCRDPWHFKVFNGEFCKEVAKGLSNGKVLINANNGILVCADVGSAAHAELSYAIQDCSAAMENLLLAASIIGLGACWMGVHPINDRVEKLTEVFNLPNNLTPISVIAFGEPTQEFDSRTRYNESKVEWL